MADEGTGSLEAKLVATSGRHMPKELGDRRIHTRTYRLGGMMCGSVNGSGLVLLNVT